MRAVAALLSLSVIAEASAGWVAEVLPEDHHFSPGRAVIYFSPEPQEGHSRFSDALAQLSQSGRIQRLEMISLHWLVRQNQDFQRDLFTALEQSAPIQLAEAKRSAGNMHNPKMIALSKPFDNAVLETQTVRDIDSKLASVGLRISDASHEKLMLVRDNAQQRFDCLLYLMVSKR